LKDQLEKKIDKDKNAVVEAKDNIARIEGFLFM